MGQDPAFKTWKLGSKYSIDEVTEKVIDMFHGELYATEYSGQTGTPALGLLVAGYGAGEMQAEAKEVVITDASTRPAATQVFTVPTSGWRAFAQPQATLRLFGGIDPDLANQVASTVDPGEWAKILPLIQAAGRTPVVDAMPFADAIELSKFLVQTTAQYSHFLLGPDTVGGVVDVAGINRHEGFRWINRKHYYPSDLNPWGRDHDH